LQRAAAAREQPAPFSQITVVRGAAPSTLSQQAARLANGERTGSPPPSTTAALPRPAPAARAASATSGRGGFQVQIGAFQSQSEAEQRLATARQAAADLLGAAAPATQQVQQGAKTLFRARFTGFDSPGATRTCDGLKKLKIDCFVMKAE
jgi:D-alanyl-D-alanine carboxypeptidase